MDDPTIPDDEAKREARRLYMRQYYLANKHRYSGYHRTYRARHYERVREKEKEWKARNPDKVRAAAKRRSREKKAEISAYHKQYAAKHRARINAYHRLYRQKGGKRRDYEREWESRNRDRINSAKRTRRRANIEKTRAEWREEAKRRRARTPIRDRSWEKRNADKVAVTTKRNKARRKGAVGSYGYMDVVAIRKLQRDRCAYCRKPLHGGGDVDHIIPIARGGSNNRSNLQLACRGCNGRKHAKDPIVFAQELGLLL